MKSLYCFIGGVSISLVLGLLVMVGIKNQSNWVSYSLSIPKMSNTTHSYLDMVQLDCMARNIFFEARGESVQGKAMVGFVVLARTESPHFPGTVCEVVHQAETDTQGYVLRDRCQFSWYCDGKIHDIDYQNSAVAKEWEQSYLIAEMVMLGKIKEPIDMAGVTHYHNGSVKPFWSKNKNYTLVAHVGRHLFYRWKKAMLPKWEPAQLAMN